MTGSHSNVSTSEICLGFGIWTFSWTTYICVCLHLRVRESQSAHWSPTDVHWSWIRTSSSGFLRKKKTWLNCSWSLVNVTPAGHLAHRFAMHVTKFSPPPAALPPWCSYDIYASTPWSYFSPWSLSYTSPLPSAWSWSSHISSAHLWCWSVLGCRTTDLQSKPSWSATHMTAGCWMGCPAPTSQ